MNRGQVKRIRKGFDRLRADGREWEALALLAKENAVEEFRSQWEETWRSLARSAFRTATGMKGFLAKLGEFSDPPDLADIRFIRTVGRYLEGLDVAGELDGMAGLSAPAETLRREILRCKAERPAGEEKTRKLLERFAAKPEGITLREYRQLQTLLRTCPSIPAAVADSLGQILALSRKLNSAAAVKKGAKGVNSPDLTIIDQGMRKAASATPPDLFRVMAAPVLAHVAAALRRVGENNPNQGACLALSVPFIMEMLAGARWDELRKRFQLETSHRISAADHSSWRKTARTASLEEKLFLINKLAQLMLSQDRLDLELQDTLVILYKEVFAELAKRRDSLTERDRKRVASVFGPVVAQHVPLLCGSMEDLPFLLDAAAAAGCLDAQSTLLQTFFALTIRDRAMIANVRGMLKLLPPIEEQDVTELFAEHNFILQEKLSLVKPMIEICRECGHEIDAMAAKGLGYSLMSSLIMNSIAGKAGKNMNFPDMSMKDIFGNISSTTKGIIKAMESFEGNPLFSFPLAIARAFPAGILSGTGYKSLLEKMLSSDIPVKMVVENITTLLRTIRFTCEGIDGYLPFGPLPGGAILQREMLEAGLDVLCGKKNMAERHSTEELSDILELVSGSGFPDGVERYLLIISNIAAERSQRGDAAAGRLHGKIMDALAQNNRSPKRRGRKR